MCFTIQHQYSCFLMQLSQRLMAAPRRYLVLRSLFIGACGCMHVHGLCARNALSHTAVAVFETCIRLWLACRSTRKPPRPSSSFVHQVPRPTPEMVTEAGEHGANCRGPHHPPTSKCTTCNKSRCMQPSTGNFGKYVPSDEAASIVCCPKW